MTDITGLKWETLSVQRDPETGEANLLEVGNVTRRNGEMTIEIIQRFLAGDFDKDVK